jgi:hypothetical protein
MREYAIARGGAFRWLVVIEPARFCGIDIFVGAGVGPSDA